MPGFNLIRLSSVCALLLAVANAAVGTGRHVLFTRDRAPEGWVQGPRATQEESPTMTFYVALAAANKNVVGKLLNEVANVDHKNYANYMSPMELREFSQAPIPLQRRVQDYFEGFHSAIACANTNGASLKCTCTDILALEKLFETTFHTFTHTETSLTVVRHVGALSVPTSLKGDVLSVTGLGSFLVFSRRKQHAVDGAVASKAGASCAGGTGCYVLPETLRNLYNVSDAQAVGGGASSQGVAEFAGNFNERDADLADFGTSVGSKSPLKVDKRGGQPNLPSQPASIEAELDIQYIAAVGAENTNWVWNSNGWMYEFSTDLQNATAAPSVISMSYAWSEAQQCGSVTGAECNKLGVNASVYVDRVNQEFAKVGLLGITLLSASGDSGCHGRTDEACLFHKQKFPDFPASSPFITAVGGTLLNDATNTGATAPICQAGGQLNNQCATGGTEVVSSTGPAGGRIASGGGFAAFSPRPSYQDAAVAEYLSNPDVIKFAGGNGTLFNNAGRGYPDIAALAHKFFIVTGGNPNSVDGTSAAAPSVAGLIGLLNAHRLRKGRKTVGFINPLLYKIHAETGGAAFNDITEGNNACTEQGCSCKTGFKAVKGWDASTGLGTLNYGVLLETMDALDEKRERLVETGTL